MICLSAGNLHAACAGEGFMGASSGDPVMSMVDITFSPLYSSSTTSGTSGCQNWDFALHLQKEREKFVRIRHQQLLEQSSAGDGPLLEAWSMLMACPREVQPRFNDLMRNHFPESEEVLNSPERMSTYPNRVLGWIRQDPVLSHACQNDDLSRTMMRISERWILVSLALLFWAFPSQACNRGGPMGLASKDPGMLSVNVTFSPTFAGASTSGTSGCKKWKFSAQVRQEFVESQWAQLREASAQGRGEHLAVFSDVMGCETEGLHVFSQMMKSNYKRLYQDQKNLLSEPMEKRRNGIRVDLFLREVENLIRENQQLQCTG